VRCPNPDEQEQDKGKPREAGGVKREARRQEQEKTEKNVHFEKVGCMQNGFYSFYRKDFLNIIKKYCRKTRNFFLRD